MSDLVLSHLWLPPLRCRALGVRRVGPSWDDCVQEGNVALLKAAERFEPERGNTFEAYARPWIDNAIKLYFCSQQAVSEPPKRVSARVAAGEPAHPIRREIVDQLSGGLHQEVVLGTEDQEDDWHSELESARGAEWLRARIAELPPDQSEALLAVYDGTRVASYARDVGLNRNTVHRRISKAMATLREAAGE